MASASSRKWNAGLFVISVMSAALALIVVQRDIRKPPGGCSDAVRRSGGVGFLIAVTVVAASPLPAARRRMDVHIDDLDLLFQRYANFGKGAAGSTGRHARLKHAMLTKLVKDAGLLRHPITPARIDLIYAQAQTHGRSGIGFAEFQLIVVPEIARHMFPDKDLGAAVQQVVHAFAALDAPKVRSKVSACTNPGAKKVTERLTATSSYTGEHTRELAPPPPMAPLPTLTGVARRRSHGYTALEGPIYVREATSCMPWASPEDARKAADARGPRRVDPVARVLETAIEGGARVGAMASVEGVPAPSTPATPSPRRWDIARSVAGLPLVLLRSRTARDALQQDVVTKVSAASSLATPFDVRPAHSPAALLSLAAAPRRGRAVPQSPIAAPESARGTSHRTAARPVQRRWSVSDAVALWQ